jgi:hypothetical protein
MVSTLPAVSAASTATSVDMIVQVVPRAYYSTNLGPQMAAGTVGSTMAILNLGPPTDFITSVAYRCRCLAACLKWIPTGPPLSRTGSVCVGYSPTSVVSYGYSYNSGQIRALSLKTYPASSDHTFEVRWLPTMLDTGFNALGSASVDDAASSAMFIGLSGVDAVGGIANGYFELTAVWEWGPPATTGVAPAPMAPPDFDINAHQSTIGDIGEYLTTGMRNFGEGVRRGVRAASGMAAMAGLVSGAIYGARRNTIRAG